MALFNIDKLNIDSNAYENTQRGNFQWKYETQREVIWVPNENGKFLMQIR